MSSRRINELLEKFLETDNDLCDGLPNIVEHQDYIPLRKRRQFNGFIQGYIHSKMSLHIHFSNVCRRLRKTTEHCAVIIIVMDQDFSLSGAKGMTNGHIVLGANCCNECQPSMLVDVFKCVQDPEGMMREVGKCSWWE